MRNSIMSERIMMNLILNPHASERKDFEYCLCKRIGSLWDHTSRHEGDRMMRSALCALYLLFESTVMCAFDSTKCHPRNLRNLHTSSSGAFDSQWDCCPRKEEVRLSQSVQLSCREFFFCPSLLLVSSPHLVKLFADVDMAK